MSNYNSYTVPVLKSMCKERGLGPISKMKKADLVELLTSGASTAPSGNSSKPTSGVRTVPNPAYEACNFPSNFSPTIRITANASGKMESKMVYPDGTLGPIISPIMYVEDTDEPSVEDTVTVPKPVTAPIPSMTTRSVTRATVASTPTVVASPATVVASTPTVVASPAPTVSPSGDGAEFLEAIQPNGTTLRVTPSSTVADLKAYAKLVGNIKTTGMLKGDLQRALGLRVQLPSKGRKPGSSTKTPEVKAQPMSFSVPMQVVHNETGYICLVNETDQMAYLTKVADIPNLQQVKEQAALTPEERGVDENTGDTVIDEFVRNSEFSVSYMAMHEMGEATTITELILCK